LMTAAAIAVTVVLLLGRGGGPHVAASAPSVVSAPLAASELPVASTSAVAPPVDPAPSSIAVAPSASAAPSPLPRGVRRRGSRLLPASTAGQSADYRVPLYGRD
jgi:hypothetical protein